VDRLGVRRDQGVAAEGGVGFASPLPVRTGRGRKLRSRAFTAPPALGAKWRFGRDDILLFSKETIDVQAQSSHFRCAVARRGADLQDRGIEVDFQPNLGKDKDRLAEIIGNYDGLAIRSATKATAKIIQKATRLKVIGRAGIGVDNVEIAAATAKGIIVMNTPFGNSITTAEHAITLMLALAREIPQADASTQAGKWEKNRFMGVEITGKTLA